jgi:hypothetical protein
MKTYKLNTELPSPRTNKHKTEPKITETLTVDYKNTFNDHKSIAGLTKSAAKSNKHYSDLLQTAEAATHASSSSIHA